MGRAARLSAIRICARNGAVMNGTSVKDRCSLPRRLARQPSASIRGLDSARSGIAAQSGRPTVSYSGAALARASRPEADCPDVRWASIWLRNATGPSADYSKARTIPGVPIGVWAVGKSLVPCAAHAASPQRKNRATPPAPVSGGARCPSRSPEPIDGGLSAPEFGIGVPAPWGRSRNERGAVTFRRARVG